MKHNLHYIQCTVLKVSLNCIDCAYNHAPICLGHEQISRRLMGEKGKIEIRASIQWLKWLGKGKL